MMCLTLRQVGAIVERPGRVATLSRGHFSQTVGKCPGDLK